MDAVGSGQRPGRVARALRRRTADFVAAGALLRPGERVLLMLSGGADSMALLDLVRAVDRQLGLGLSLSALHVDYATRGAASARDRHIVTAACRALDVPLHVVRLSHKPEGAAFQERARSLRYDAAREIMARGGADVAVTAHNRDDQAETVLYRLVKYAGPSSLRAMRPREDGLARPLLCLGAAELRAYCRELGIVYGQDESNAGTAYRRNLLRHEVLPVLEAVNPRVAETLADAAALADDEHAVLAAALDDAWRRVARRSAGTSHDATWALDVAALAAEPPALRALCLRRLARGVLGDDALIGRRLTQRLSGLAAGTAGSRGVSLSAGFEAVREYELLTVRARAVTHACPPAPLAPGTSAVFCGLAIAPNCSPARASSRRRPKPGSACRDPTARSCCATRDAATAGGRSAWPARCCSRTSSPALAYRARGGRRAVVAQVDGRIAWVCPGRSSEWFRVGPGTPYTLHICPEATEAT